MIRKSTKIESPNNNSWLDSRIVSYIDELSSRLYFWVDKNLIDRGGYDINKDNGFFINNVSHTVFKLRKAVPAAKELYQEGLLNPLDLVKLELEYLSSFLDKKRIQFFKDEYENEFYALNLYLEDPSTLTVSELIKGTNKRVEIILGNCSKGHVQEETISNKIHICDYRIQNGCYYKVNKKSDFNANNFNNCEQNPCLIGNLNKLMQEINVLDHKFNLNTILGGYQTFREIPGFFKMNTEKGEPKFIIWGTCNFSVPYLIRAARMFPNIEGLILVYKNGCKTLGDRAIRLRGDRRDQHITRFKGPNTIYENPISRIIR